MVILVPLFCLSAFTLAKKASVKFKKAIFLTSYIAYLNEQQPTENATKDKFVEFNSHAHLAKSAKTTLVNQHFELSDTITVTLLKPIT